MNIDLYTEQENIEQQSRASTIQRYKTELADKIQNGEQSSTHYGAALMKRAIEPMAEIIEAEREAIKNGKAGNNTVVWRKLGNFDAHEAAFLTSREVINFITSNGGLTETALKVGQVCEDEMRYTAFQQEKPWLFKKILAETETTKSRKRQTIIAAANRYAAPWANWSKSERLHVGTSLINIFVEATGFAEIVKKVEGKNRTVYRMQPTQAVVDFIEQNKDAVEMLNPILLPMVVEPVDWTTPTSGGYLTHHTPQLPFIKAKTNAQGRNYLEDLHGHTDKMCHVYDAINTIQRTSWRVNPFVLETFKQVYELGLPIAGLPDCEDIPLPPSPLHPDRDTKTLNDEEKEQFKLFKKRASAVYSANVALISKRLMNAKIFSIAKQFSVYEAIWFVHTTDFRGRAYPAAMYLNPQGNGIAKGLLEFAEGKALGSNDAAFELAVHGANCFGNDKGSLEERIDWVEENTDRILKVASDPMDDLWWAKEADEPWCFLAFCKEWAGFTENGYDHISHVAVAKDGSCSGLQHFSAALRDPVGGNAVNLVPAQKPQDIYQCVIDLAVTKIQSDIGGENDKIAQALLKYGLSRRAAKRCTMCFVYGAKQHSYVRFVLEYVNDTDAKRKQEDREYVSSIDGFEFDASVYLAKKISESIDETVIAAKDGMNWLRQCARTLATENLPISWTTYDGFPVLQSYPDTRRKSVKTKLGDKMVYLSLREEKNGRMDRSKQTNGISPNWVHSNDGCHLRMTVNLAAHNGVTHFAMIHDSFGCHAADVPMLSECLREAFLDLYLNHDPLVQFHSDAQKLTNTVLPNPPYKGTLDLGLVKKSEFFFA
jgi:DNA-directed RNA polymerase